MIQASQRHLQEAGESYFEHLRFAGTVGLIAVGAGLACLVHATVPALCQRSCSRTVRLLGELFANRQLRQDVGRHCSGIITFAGLSLLAVVAAIMPIARGGPEGITLALAFLSLCFPMTYLLTNRELEAESEADGDTICNQMG